MRLATALLLLPAFTLPSTAATFVQELPAVEGIADMGPFDVRGQLFDSALGNLTGVTGTLHGTYISGIGGVRAIADQEILTTIVYTLGFGPGNSVSGVAGTQYAFLNSGFPGLSGGPYSFSVSVSFPNVTEFLRVPDINGPNTTLLGVFSIGTRVAPGLITMSENGFSDLSNFHGTFQLTYTYDLPEPSTDGLLCLGILSLSLVRWRSTPSSVSSAAASPPSSLLASV